jgi:hypothetical protein
MNMNECVKRLAILYMVKSGRIGAGSSGEQPSSPQGAPAQTQDFAEQQLSRRLPATELFKRQPQGQQINNVE